MSHRDCGVFRRIGLAWCAVVVTCLSFAQTTCTGKMASGPAHGKETVLPTAAAREQVASATLESRDAAPSTSASSSAAVRSSPVNKTSASRSIRDSVVEVQDPLLVRGAELFTKSCVICHGENGDGGGKFAYLMNPRPRDFQKGDFKLATTQNQIPSDTDLIRTISNGMPGSAMPPWGHLPDADLEALAKYVRSLHVIATEQMLKQWVADGSIADSELAEMLASRTKPSAALVIPPEPPFGEVRWFHGRTLYLENCASCHGVDGHPMADAVKFDAEGYPVPPRSFVDGIFKGSSEGYQLYARIWKGMLGTPMPASEGIYSGDDMWDLIHYVQSLARQGAQARAQLKQGTFVAPNIRRPLPSSPTDDVWERARPLYVGLTPLWWAEERIEGLVVKALHNGDELAIRLSWIDPTLDNRAVRHDEFRDAVAIQFSLTSDPPFYMGDASDHGGVNIWMWKADRQQDIAEGYQDVDAAFPARAIDMYPEQNFRLTDRSKMEWPHQAITQHDSMFITAWGAGNIVANPKLKTPVECLVARGPGTLSGKPA
ncbi:MAG: c-type cytochrome, partial [Planctomycetes bacterium]|nr:c-type cytochrome [Planctomycetota bacterium]